jgi:hypothetical protein
MSISRFEVLRIYENIARYPNMKLVMNSKNISRTISSTIDVAIGDNLFFGSDDKYLGKCSADKFTHTHFKQNTENRVRRLVHFTDSSNLKNIKRHGLLSENELSQRNITHSINDRQRFDRQLDGICFTLEKANERLLTAYSYNNPSKTYVKLFVKPTILFDLLPDVPLFRIYYDHNAAASQSQSSTDNVEIMFKNELCIETFNYIYQQYLPQNFNRINKSDYETTSPQAEVMIFGCIPAKYIFLDENFTRCIKDECYE